MIVVDDLSHSVPHALTDSVGSQSDQFMLTATASANTFGADAGKLITAIRLELHLHPPPRQLLDAFVDTVKREDRYVFANVQDDAIAWQEK